MQGNVTLPPQRSMLAELVSIFAANLGPLPASGYPLSFPVPVSDPSVISSGVNLSKTTLGAGQVRSCATLGLVAHAFLGSPACRTTQRSSRCCQSANLWLRADRHTGNLLEGLHECDLVRVGQ